MRKPKVNVDDYCKCYVPTVGKHKGDGFLQFPVCGSCRKAITTTQMDRFGHRVIWAARFRKGAASVSGT